MSLYHHYNNNLFCSEIWLPTTHTVIIKIFTILIFLLVSWNEGLQKLYVKSLNWAKEINNITYWVHKFSVSVEKLYNTYRGKNFIANE